MRAFLIKLLEKKPDTSELRKLIELLEYRVEQLEGKVSALNMAMAFKAGRKDEKKV